MLFTDLVWKRERRREKKNAYSHSSGGIEEVKWTTTTQNSNDMMWTTYIFCVLLKWWLKKFASSHTMKIAWGFSFKRKFMDFSHGNNRMTVTMCIHIYYSINGTACVIICHLRTRFHRKKESKNLRCVIERLQNVLEKYSRRVMKNINFHRSSVTLSNFSHLYFAQNHQMHFEIVKTFLFHNM